jgi:hypothetical protein
MTQKQKKPYSFLFEDPLFNSCVYVVAGEAEACKQATVKRLNIMNPEFIDFTNAFAGYTVEIRSDFGNVYVLWLNERDKKFSVKNTDDVATLNHEILHVVSMVLRFVGIAHTTETEEVYAYMQTWMFKEICKKLEKRK